MIPRRLHQIWIGPRPVPRAIESWRDRHPDWEHHLWTEETIPFPLKNQAQYDASGTYSGKSNVVRFEMLDRYGGVYVDADTGCLRPLDEELMQDDFFCVYEDERSLPGRIGTTYFGCTAGHPVVQSMVDAIGRETSERISRTPSWKITGPLRFTEIIDGFNDVSRLPSHLFFPLHHSGNQCTDDEFDRAYAIHFWDTTYAEMGLYPEKLMDYADLFGFIPAGLADQMEPRGQKPVRERTYEPEPGIELSGDRAGCVTKSGKVAINPPAIAILELCDGESTVENVVSILAGRYPDHAKQIYWDVPLTILRLYHYNILRLVA